MCGRYVLAASPEQLALEFDLADASAVTASYNIAPTQVIAAITHEQPRALSLLRWGLIPSWSKDMSMGARLINARAETIDEKPAFRAAFKRRRCLIPASGFYEWRKEADGSKTPVYIHIKSREVFAFAGLWEIWHSPEGDEAHSCTIITTAANTFMASIHERMPVILDRDDYGAWLLTDEPGVPGLKALLRPYADDHLTAYEVSKAVNRPGHDAPELIAPLRA